MRPKKHQMTGSNDLFRARLDQIINLKHELVQLVGKVDWDWIDGEIAPLYSEHGRPGIATRFMIGLLLLKHIYGLSDEGVCERWVHDPYFQYFTGEEFFQHAFPHERSDLSHWRKRLGDKLELLLAESLRVAHGAGALRSNDLKRVTVDTTVQPKAITFPTDAKLLHAAIKGLNRLAARHGVRLRQSYLRIAKGAAMMAGRYAHAKQFKRHQRQLRILRSRLGLRVPCAPPLGPLFVGSHGAPGEGEWIRRLGRPDQETVDAALSQLERVRARGWSIALQGPDDGDSLEELVALYSDRHRTPGQERRLLAAAKARAGLHEPAELPPDASYDLRHLSVPVRDGAGQVLLVLRLSALPPGASLQQVQGWLGRLQESAARLEQSIAARRARCAFDRAA